MKRVRGRPQVKHALISDCDTVCSDVQYYSIHRLPTTLNLVVLMLWWAGVSMDTVTSLLLFSPIYSKL